MVAKDQLKHDVAVFKQRPNSWLDSFTPTSFDEPSHQLFPVKADDTGDWQLQAETLNSRLNCFYALL